MCPLICLLGLTRSRHSQNRRVTEGRYQLSNTKLQWLYSTLSSLESMSAGPPDVLTKLKEQEVKTSVPWLPQLVFHYSKPRLLLSGLFPLKLSLRIVAQLGITERLFHVTHFLLSKGFLNAFPVTTCFQTSCSAHALKNVVMGGGGSWAGSGDHKPLTPATYKEMLSRQPQDGLWIPQPWKAPPPPEQEPRERQSTGKGQRWWLWSWTLKIKSERG